MKVQKFEINFPLPPYFILDILVVLKSFFHIVMSLVIVLNNYN